MSEDEREPEAPRANDGKGGAGRYADPGDAGAPLSEEPGGTSDGTHGTSEPAADPNPTPRREEAGL